MKQESIKILAIESSCDETAVAVIGESKGKPVILSNIVSSQIDLHAKTGGVVPEVASRAHMESILPVISEALIEASQIISNSELRIFPPLDGIPPEAVTNQIPNDKLINEKINDQWKMENDHYQQAIKLLDGITHIAVTAGPGLIGSLLVGFNAAKTLAYAKKLPIIPINHIEGHVYSAFAEQFPMINDQLSIKLENEQIGKCKNNKIESVFPALALTVSGGHTSLTLMRDHGEYETLGETLDDAAGEAFDKVAKLLGLGYPGGPVVSKLASEHRNKYQLSMINDQLKSNDQINDKMYKCKNSKIYPSGILFPRPILNDGTFNFSFSGLKTAVLQKVINIKKQNGDTSRGEMSPAELPRVRGNGGTELSDEIKQEICAAFEDAVVDVLVTKTMRAADKYKPKAIILAGGVAANELLRETLELSTLDLKLATKFLVPPKIYCGDNAVMIGLAAYYHILRGDVSDWQEIKVDSNLSLCE